MPVPHLPARRPSPARRRARTALLLLLLSVTALVASLIASGAHPVPATAAGPPATTPTAGRPTLKGPSRPSAPPVADEPCPGPSSADGPRSSCDESVPRTDPSGTRCHRKTVDALARSGSTRRLVVQASLTLRWCSEGGRLVRSRARYAGTAGDGLAIAVDRDPRIRRPRRGVAVGEVRFRVGGRPRTDVYASTTPGAVLRSRRRVVAGRRVDERLDLRLTVRADGRATARCGGRIVACRVTPGDG